LAYFIVDFATSFSWQKAVNELKPDTSADKFVANREPVVASAILHWVTVDECV
jgi:hypothetical protein